MRSTKKSKNYLDKFHARGSNEEPLKELEPGVVQAFNQTYGVMFVKLEKCEHCKKYCVDEDIDEEAFPRLMTYNLDAQLIRNGWGKLSPGYSQKYGKLCTVCDVKLLGHICRECKHPRA